MKQQKHRNEEGMTLPEIIVNKSSKIIKGMWYYARLNTDKKCLE